MPIYGDLESWEVYSEDSLNVVWAHGSPYPSPRRIHIISSDFTPIMQDYSDFKIEIRTLFYNNAFPFIEISGDYYENGVIYPASDAPLSTYLSFLNLGNFPQGEYQVALSYTLKGKRGSAWKVIRTKNISLKLTITGASTPQITTDKQQYICYYDKITGAFSGEKTVNILNNNDNLNLSFEPESTFVPKGPFVNQFELELGTLPMLPESGQKEVSGYITQNGNRIVVFRVIIIIIDNNLAVTPTSLHFFVRRNNNEILTKPINIVNPGNISFAVSGPNWLSLSQTSGSSSVVINVSNVSPLTMDNGVYNDNVVINYLSKNIVIPVKLEIVTSTSHNFDEEYNFCLDAKILNVFKYDSKAFFSRITLKMTFVENNQSIVVEVPYIIPYFQDKVQLNVGEKIHHAFKKNRKSILEEGTVAYNFDNKIHLHPASVEIKVEELDTNNAVVYSENIPSKRFYPGKKPKGFPFLTNHLMRSHVEGAKTIISFISGLVTAENILDVSVSSAGLPNEVIARVKIEDEENKINFIPKKTIQATTGPAIEIYNLNTDDEKVFLQWENQNFAPESMTFTGDYTLPEEFTHLTQKNMFSGIPEKYETLTNQKLLINTGFILKAEKEMISEIIKSLFCIIQFGDKFLRGHCVSSKLVKEDKKRQLVQFDLEFEIKD